MLEVLLYLKVMIMCIKPEEKGLLELLDFAYNWIGTCGCAYPRGHSEIAHPAIEEWVKRCDKARAFYKKKYEKQGRIDEDKAVEE